MTLALAHGTIYTAPYEEPLRDAHVIIDGARIAAVGSAIPPGANVVDCTGLTITAGLWNSHVHLFERKWDNAASLPAAELDGQLRDMFLRFGFTHVFDLGSSWENTRAIRARIESGEVAGPHIRSTGEVLIAPGAMPPDIVMRIMGLMRVASPEVSDADGARAAARRLLDSGVDGIKLHMALPLAHDIIVAAVREAHSGRKPVFVHPSKAADVIAALNAGVDVIAHTTTDTLDCDPRGAALIPTLQLWKYFMRHDRLSKQTQMVTTAVEQLRTWRERGGRVLFGTDAGAVDYDPADEYALMAQAGMSARDILASLTTTPAEIFGESSHAGRIEPGFDADLVIYRRGLFSPVQYIVSGGRLL